MFRKWRLKAEKSIKNECLRRALKKKKAHHESKETKTSFHLPFWKTTHWYPSRSSSSLRDIFVLLLRKFPTFFRKSITMQSIPSCSNQPTSFLLVSARSARSKCKHFRKKAFLKKNNNFLNSFLPLKTFLTLLS